MKKIIIMCSVAVLLFAMPLTASAHGYRSQSQPPCPNYSQCQSENCSDENCHIHSGNCAYGCSGSSTGSQSRHGRTHH